MQPELTRFRMTGRSDLHMSTMDQLIISPSSCCSTQAIPVRSALWFIGFIAALYFSPFKALARETTQAVNGSSVCQNLVPSPRLEQFVDELPRLRTIHVNNRKQVTLGAYKITQKLHRDLPPTTLYAFGTSRATATYPGPTLWGVAWVESYVRFENHIHDEEPLFTVDRTVMWANPKRGGVPTVTHLHGAETESIFDGNPDAWFTAKGEYGPAYITQNYTYANSQFPTMLWYHDHTFGITRLNILAGLLGLYIIKPAAASRSEKGTQPATPPWLPTKKFEWTLVLGDKQFFPNGSINFPNTGDSPKVHSNWCSEYYGDTIVVNGKIWPYLHVHARKYRFRLLNSANARIFELSLSSDPRVSFVQIGTDGGLLERPQTVSTITISPAERVDFILDFSTLSAGSEVIMNNSGAAPYPNPTASLSPVSTKAVMKFIVLPKQQQKHHDDQKQADSDSSQQQNHHDEKQAQDSSQQQKHHVENQAKDSSQQQNHHVEKQAKDSSQQQNHHVEKQESSCSSQEQMHDGSKLQDSSGNSFQDHHDQNLPTTTTTIPAILRKQDTNISMKDVSYWRVTNMTEIDDEEGNPIQDLQNNSTWRDRPVLIQPVVGTTEVWEFINLTPDAHPMHIHLIQFHFLNQQSFNLSLYLAGGCSFQVEYYDHDDESHQYHNRSSVSSESESESSEPESSDSESEFSSSSSTTTTRGKFRSCYTEEAKGPLPNQIGWKDTMLAWPGNVTRVLIKWTSQNGSHFPFDPTQGPGYVWHCHISDHEDNAMLRPFKMQY